MLPAIATSLVAYLAAICTYRLFFHPLSRFPGPSLAAVTDGYAAWYEVVKKGEIVHELDRLHKVYGPIVRIGPGKLHFNTPRAFDDIYRSPKLIKPGSFYDAFQMRQSSFGFSDPRLAKERREIIGPLFSRKAVLRLEGVVQDVVDRLVSELSKYPSNDTVNLRHGLMAASLEVITTYCFAKEYHALEYPAFKHPVIPALESISMHVLFFAMMCLPFLEKISFGMPEWLAKLLGAGSGDMQDLFGAIAKQVDEVLNDPLALERAEHEIIYHHLLSAGTVEKGGKPPSRQSLIDEASVMITAGTETIANACTVACFHLSRSPDIERRLREELIGAWSDASAHMPLERLEKLPYLTAVIKEGLRLSHGIVTPLPRQAHDGVVIDGVDIPPGAIVAMGHTFMHLSPELFEDPLAFNPERWLTGDAQDRHVVSFSRGPRVCLGVNLAWAELYLILGNLFRKVQMELPEDRPERLEYHELLPPHYKGDPLQVHIRKLADQ
ncbi:cytochrome P450 [Ephemerocybe angulata]|uniref:Cytochrome P450 n=1 Tax=Ephemerocybe angulata TaxID=980116 RepID=A0A8H6M0Y1_9AGAR|nr:cytochrome P450 [Tulosesus angulatus]